MRTEKLKCAACKNFQFISINFYSYLREARFQFFYTYTSYWIIILLKNVAILAKMQLKESIWDRLPYFWFLLSFGEPLYFPFLQEHMHCRFRIRNAIKAFQFHLQKKFWCLQVSCNEKLTLHAVNESSFISVEKACFMNSFKLKLSEHSGIHVSLFI